MPSRSSVGWKLRLRAALMIDAWVSPSGDAAASISTATVTSPAFHPAPPVVTMSPKPCASISAMYAGDRLGGGDLGVLDVDETHRRRGVDAVGVLAGGAEDQRAAAQVLVMYTTGSQSGWPPWRWPAR